MNHLALSYMQPWSGESQWSNLASLSFANRLIWLWSAWEVGRLCKQEESSKAAEVDRWVTFSMALAGYGAL